jgi:hypothetical protein
LAPFSKGEIFQASIKVRSVNGVGLTSNLIPPSLYCNFILPLCNNTLTIKVENIRRSIEDLGEDVEVEGVIGSIEDVIDGV